MTFAYFMYEELFDFSAFVWALLYHYWLQLVVIFLLLKSREIIFQAIVILQETGSKEKFFFAGKYIDIFLFLFDYPRGIVPNMGYK